MPKFSVITPAYCHSEDRKRALERCIRSVDCQTIGTDRVEHLVIDQTEVDEFRIDRWHQSFVKYYEQAHMERLYALRRAFEEAQGEWICLLDSDDIYLPHYLETVSQVIEGNPGYKLLNFGSLHIHKDGRVVARDAFKPKRLEVGHEIFSGGTIVNGTFVFHRSVWEDLGDFPTTTEKLWNPWDFSIAAQEEFPELKEFFMVDHEDEPEKIAKELGNPWGQDYYLFYKYTRKYHSLSLDKHLLGVYCK